MVARLGTCRALHYLGVESGGHESPRPLGGLGVEAFPPGLGQKESLHPLARLGPGALDGHVDQEPDPRS